jgi:hypothetical protein
MEKRTYPPMTKKIAATEGQQIPAVPPATRNACHCRECRCRDRKADPSGIRCHEVPY